MIGIYFSGTGNTRHCVEKFAKEYDPEAIVYSIEDSRLPEIIRRETEIVFGYATQYSSIPKILRDFIIHNQVLWQDKKSFHSDHHENILWRRFRRIGKTAGNLWRNGNRRFTLKNAGQYQ